MIRIALINPKMEGPYPPLGLGYIASYLRRYGRHEYDIRLFDGNVRAELRPDIEAFDPDIAGFTGHSPQALEAVRLSRELRSWKKELFQVIGGVHASADPAGTLGRGSFDLAVVGEGEETFREIVDGFAEGSALCGIPGTARMENGTLVMNRKRAQIDDLDRIPFPARDLFDMDHYLSLSFGVRGRVMKGVTSITSSRGCPYKCTFCGVNIVYRKVRQFSREYCLSEIEELHSRYGARALYFADDTFVTDKKAVAAFSEAMIKRGLSKKVSWTAQARANLIGWGDLPLLKLMREAGCIQLEYGFESGSERVLASLKQGRVTIEDNQRAIEVTRAAGLRLLATFIVGTPGETEADLSETRAFIRRNIGKLDYFQTFICTPFPGSPIYEECLERGLVEGDYFDELERREKAAGPLVFTDTISKEKVIAALRELDYLGLRKVSLIDKLVWVAHHFVNARKDVSHRDRNYIFKRLYFYFSSIARSRA